MAPDRLTPCRPAASAALSWFSRPPSTRHDLPDHVSSSIPLRPQPGEPGLHGLARGLLIETSQRLDARPVSLAVTRLGPSPAIIRAELDIDAPPVGGRARHRARDGRIVTVEVILISGPAPSWRLLLEDQSVATGTGRVSPAYLADLLASRVVEDRRTPGSR